MKNNKTKEILQKEWGYLTRKDNRKFLATPNVQCCTAFYGTDECNEIGFMCHFDFSWSTKALPQLFAVLETHIPKSRKIICYIDGGHFFLHSFFTRASIMKYIRKCNMNGWNIQPVIKPYNMQLYPFKFCLGKGIKYDYIENISTHYPMKPQLRKATTLKDVIRFSAKLYDD